MSMITSKNEPGTIYANRHRDYNDIFIVLGNSVHLGADVTLVMWSNGAFNWYETLEIGSIHDRKL